MKALITSILVALLSVVIHAQDENATVGAKTERFKVKAGEFLEVNLNVADVEITTSNENEVAVEIPEMNEEERDNLKITQSGSAVRVSMMDGWDDLTFRIKIPEAFSINVRLQSGSISVNGDLRGEVKVATAGGDIRLSSVTGRVDVNTMGGEIATGNINGDVILNTSGGDISMGNIEGEGEIKTMGGEIRLKNVTKRLSARTYGGDIQIGRIGGDADVSTYGGEINVQNVEGRAHLYTAGGDIVLAGSSGKVDMKTNGGNLTLKNITGSINGSTSSGDVTLEMDPKGKGESRINTSAGTITLLVPASAKANIEARIKVNGYWKRNKDSFHITSDFKAEESSRAENERMIKENYQLNGGGERIILETINSDIQIKKIK
ncbi:MAG: DUF4097 family beta strand repeat-containing protein [Methanococcaceae archaeon]